MSFCSPPPLCRVNQPFPTCSCPAFHNPENCTQAQPHMLLPEQETNAEAEQQEARKQRLHLAEL